MLRLAIIAVVLAASMPPFASAGPIICDEGIGPVDCGIGNCPPSDPMCFVPEGWTRNLGQLREKTDGFLGFVEDQL